MLNILHNILFSYVILEYAANSKTIVELLIQKNFVVNVCFKNLSALRWATIFQFNEIKQLLQESGASS
jgi:hypothetical protein